MNAVARYREIVGIREEADRLMKELVQRHAHDLIKNHDGVRAAGRAAKIDPCYLHKLRRGEKTKPSSSTLRKLGIDIKRK